MFKSIRLKHFKAYRDSGLIPLAPLTILIGQNNVGKSTILQAIGALAQSHDQTSQALATTGPLVDLGGFYDMLHRNSTTPRSFTISLALDSEEVRRLKSQRENLGERGLPVVDRIDLSFGLGARTREIRVKKSVLWTGDEKLLETRVSRVSSDLHPLQPDDDVQAGFVGFMPVLLWRRRKSSRTSVLRALGLATRRNAEVWSSTLARVHRIGPLRARVPWYSGLGTSTPQELGLGGADLVAQLGIHRERGPDVIDRVNFWVSEKLGILRRLHVESLDKASVVRALLADEREGVKDINAAAMGEGISQVLPIILRATAGKRAECLLVEQPEIHLHPSLQSDLADLFISITHQGNRQVILETHSEHLLLRIRRRVAEGLDPEKVGVLYVERTGSESTVRRLQMNGKGLFDDWPKGFFENAYQEAMALTMANPKKE